MLTPIFYNKTIKKYLSLFGTLFNNISIERRLDDENESKIQQFLIPIGYGPAQKWLSRINQDPQLNAPSITLPRMSYEIVGISFDSDRKTSDFMIMTGSSSSSTKAQFNPVPYDLDFQLSIMTKYHEDGIKIIEQILPFFRPDFTVSAKMVDGSDKIYDIPIILNSISSDDNYETIYEGSRVIIWTLLFTLKGSFFGPTYDRKIIKFVEANIYSDITANTPVIEIDVYPGMTANNQPTNNSNNSINWSLIDSDDNWGYIINIDENI